METRVPIGKRLTLGLVYLTAMCGLWITGCGVARRGSQVAPVALPTASSTPLALLPTHTFTPIPSPTLSPSCTPTQVPTVLPTTTPTLSPNAVTPTASPSETLVPSTPQAPSPTIRYFRADVDIADPGDVITLSWSSSGATGGVLYKLFYSGQLPAHGLDVAPSGTITYTIPEEERNWITLMLYVEDAEQRHATATTTVRLRCPSPWFFAPQPEDICPTQPLVSRAAEQHFEAGTMIWIEAEDAIYVLYEGETIVTPWNRFEDLWHEGLPDRDPDLVPPTGLQQPIRGFGLIWREQPGVREQLGWAIDGEQGFSTVMQRTTRYKYNAWYLLALDGGIWYLGPERSSWDKLTDVSLTMELSD